jgi:hypothetical protein
MDVLNDNIPRLPEHYRPRLMSDMFPDEVAHLYPSAVVADKHTGYLHINRQNSLESDCAAPSFYGNRVGIMRIYGPIEGVLKNGFIADLRYASNGSIPNYFVTAAEGADDGEISAAEDIVRENKYELLLAAIVLDPDDNEQFVGDPSLFSTLSELRETVESVRNKDEAPTNETTEQSTVIPTERGEYVLKSGLIVVKD